MKNRIILPALLALALAAPVAAQQDPQATPEALAMETQRRAAASDWDGIAALVDPRALERVHGTFMRLVELDPDPQALSMFGVSTVEQFRALDPRAVMAAFYRLGTAQMGLDQVAFLDTRVVGVVREDPDFAHVVLRQGIRVMGIEAAPAELMTMRQHEGRWWVQLAPEMEGTLMGLESQLPPEAE